MLFLAPLVFLVFGSLRAPFAAGEGDVVGVLVEAQGVRHFDAEGGGAI